MQHALVAQVCLLSQVIIAAVFGYIWPQLKWKWGVWITILSSLVLLLSVGGELERGNYRNALLLFIIVLLIITAACGSALLSARLSPRERPNNSFNRSAS